MLIHCQPPQQVAAPMFVREVHIPSPQVEATATNGTITWTEDGAGSITAGDNTETPTYKADPSDVGAVTLTMTVTSINSCSSQTTTAKYTLNITPTTANAGDDITTCADAGPIIITSDASATNSVLTLWESSGTGEFSDPFTVTNCTYTPSAEDIAAGGVTITLTAFADAPCSNVIDSKILIIKRKFLQQPPEEVRRFA